MDYAEAINRTEDEQMLLGEGRTEREEGEQMKKQAHVTCRGRGVSHPHGGAN
jgi:hypothetical protein